ncbi:MAG: four helix bundle protein, partial [Bacteroidetes bacterium]|nr:four helix bundle protein [Bacteroidota bacterium]
SGTEYLILLCKDLAYVDTEIYERIHAELISIKKQLYQLIKKINEN